MRDHTLRLMDDLFEALDLTTAPVVGHSLGRMFALRYTAARPALGEAVLRTPMPRPGLTP